MKCCSTQCYSWKTERKRPSGTEEAADAGYPGERVTLWGSGGGEPLHTQDWSDSITKGEKVAAKTY